MSSSSHHKKKKKRKKSKKKSTTTTTTSPVENQNQNLSSTISSTKSMDTVVSPISHAAKRESTEMDESFDNEEMQYNQLIFSSSSTSVVMGEGEEEKRKKE